jgi:hypothetical protein
MHPAMIEYRQAVEGAAAGGPDLPSDAVLAKLGYGVVSFHEDVRRFRELTTMRAKLAEHRTVLDNPTARAQAAELRRVRSELAAIDSALTHAGFEAGRLEQEARILEGERDWLFGPAPAALNSANGQAANEPGQQTRENA